MIKNLVISGGGVKIIAIIGVIKYLEEKNLLNNIHKFYGTSAGSLLCLLIILGFSSSEIIKFIETFNMEKIFHVNTDDFFTNYSICNNNKFEKLIKLFINFKITTNDLENIDNNFENITMLELFNKTNKFLTITTISLKQKKAIYIDHLNFPNLPVCKAILMSCSIPLIFQPIPWEDDLYIDGALIDNFPLFTIPHNEVKNTLGLETCINHSINYSCSDIYDYLLNIYKIITQTNKKYKNYNIISIMIDPNIVTSSIDINLSLEIKTLLINEGYDQTSKIYPTLFQNINEDKYIQTEKILYRNRSKSI